MRKAEASIRSFTTAAEYTSRDSSVVDRPIFYNTTAWLATCEWLVGRWSLAVCYRFYCTLSRGMAMIVSSLVHWPLMGGLLQLVLVGSFGIHANYVYK